MPFAFFAAPCTSRLYVHRIFNGFAGKAVRVIGNNGNYLLSGGIEADIIAPNTFSGLDKALAEAAPNTLVIIAGNFLVADGDIFYIVGGGDGDLYVLTNTVGTGGANIARTIITALVCSSAFIGARETLPSVE